MHADTALPVLAEVWEMSVNVCKWGVFSDVVLTVVLDLLVVLDRLRVCQIERIV